MRILDFFEILYIIFLSRFFNTSTNLNPAFYTHIEFFEKILLLSSELGPPPPHPQAYVSPHREEDENRASLTFYCNECQASSSRSDTVLSFMLKNASSILLF